MRFEALLLAVMEPLAWPWKNNCERPTPSSGKARPKRTRQMSTMTAARRSWVSNAFTCSRSSVPVHRGEEQVDQLDEDERRDDPADAVDEDVAPENGGGARGPPLDAAQGQRDE